MGPVVRVSMGRSLWLRGKAQIKPNMRVKPLRLASLLGLMAYVGWHGFFLH